MKIEDLKKDLKNIRSPDMEKIIPSGKTGYSENFFDRLKNQDKRDEQFIVTKRITPVLIGLIAFTTTVIIAQIRTPVLFIGSFLIFSSLLAILIMYLLDYRDISKETFHESILQFLNKKKKRLSYWKSTPFKHNIIFTLFLSGWLLFNIGNKPFIHSVGKFPFIVVIGLVFLIMLLLHFNSERLYRKRHKREHEPLLKMISELQEELENEKEI
jgi:hypothetical protein